MVHFFIFFDGGLYCRRRDLFATRFWKRSRGCIANGRKKFIHVMQLLKKTPDEMNDIDWFLSIVESGEEVFSDRSNN